MNRLSCLLIVLIIFISFVANSKAQETNIRGEIAYGFGIGLGFGSMSVGDNSNSNIGLSLNGHIGNHFLLMVEVNPLPVKSPVMDESFNAFNNILSPSFGKTFRLRTGLGLQFRIWSGSEKVENIDIGPIICIDAGYEFRKSDKYSLVIEIVFRNSLIEIEGSVTSKFIGLQIVALSKK
jgi:hypothetical protein